MRYVLGKHIAEYKTAAEFMAHVKSLAIADDTIPDATSVPDFRLSVRRSEAKAGEDTSNQEPKITVYCQREIKQLTVDESERLALEYKLDPVAFRQLLTTRGYALYNEAGDQVNAKPKRTRARKPKRTEAQENAHLTSGGSPDGSGDQLFVSGANPDVPQESTLQPQPGTQATG